MGGDYVNLPTASSFMSGSDPIPPVNERLLLFTLAAVHITGFPRLGWLTLILLGAAIPLARRLRTSGHPGPILVAAIEPMIEATG